MNQTINLPDQSQPERKPSPADQKVGQAKTKQTDGDTEPNDSGPASPEDQPGKTAGSKGEAQKPAGSRA